MCEPGITVPVRVKIAADLSCTGKPRWKMAEIDACIADLVQALQRGGIDMRGSCCGHGKSEGHISLVDGRYLIITDRSYIGNQFKWSCRAARYWLWHKASWRWRWLRHRILGKEYWATW